MRKEGGGGNGLASSLLLSFWPQKKKKHASQDSIRPAPSRTSDAFPPQASTLEGSPVISSDTSLNWNAQFSNTNPPKTGIEKERGRKTFFFLLLPLS